MGLGGGGGGVGSIQPEHMFLVGICRWGGRARSGFIDPSASRSLFVISVRAYCVGVLGSGATVIWRSSFAFPIVSISFVRLGS